MLFWSFSLDRSAVLPQLNTPPESKSSCFPLGLISAQALKSSRGFKASVRLPLSDVLSSPSDVCLMLFLSLVISRPPDSPRGWAMPGSIGSPSSYHTTEAHRQRWLMAGETPQGSFCPRFLPFQIHTRPLSIIHTVSKSPFANVSFLVSIQ